MKRVLITVSRTWDTWDEPFQAFDRVREEWPDEEIVLVHGDAPNGDRDLARIARYNYGWKVEAHPARWREHGIYNPQAGLLRNREMVAAGANVCLAFIRGGSRGASHCARLAEEAGIETRRYLR